MRYLLDELMAYEEGFSDIMMPDHTPDRHETFMGVPDLSSSPSKTDLLTLEGNLIQQFHNFITVFMSQLKSSTLGEYRRLPVFQLETSVLNLDQIRQRSIRQMGQVACSIYPNPP
jgi:hypothetical protein